MAGSGVKENNTPVREIFNHKIREMKIIGKIKKNLIVIITTEEMDAFILFLQKEGKIVNGLIEPIPTFRAVKKVGDETVFQLEIPGVE